MNISLTRELEQFVSHKVDSGMYHTASEVVREGLRLLKERDELHQSKLSELQRDITVGIEQADRGETQPFNEDTTARIKARGRKQLPGENGSEPA